MTECGVEFMLLIKMWVWYRRRAPILDNYRRTLVGFRHTDANSTTQTLWINKSSYTKLTYYSTSCLYVLSVPSQCPCRRVLHYQWCCCNAISPAESSLRIRQGVWVFADPQDFSFTNEFLRRFSWYLVRRPLLLLVLHVGGVYCFLHLHPHEIPSNRSRSSTIAAMAAELELRLQRE